MSNTLIVIKPSNSQYSKSLVLEDYTYIREFTNETLMEIIIDEIGLTPDLVGDTQTCFESGTNIFQLCFVGYNENTELKEVNTIATYLNGETVYGNAVLINSKINEDYLCCQDSSKISDLETILFSKFNHKGICIPVNDDDAVSEFEYQNHPLEYLEPSEKTYGKYKLFECTFLGFQLGFFGEVNNTNVNKRATRLLGNKKLFGNVVLFNKLPHEFQDIDMELFIKFNKLSYGSLKDREPTNSEDREGQKINGLPVAFNRYCLLNKRYAEYKKICNSCKEELKSEKLVCTGCFRVRYHNKECQKNDWSTHKTECLYN